MVVLCTDEEGVSDVDNAKVPSLKMRHGPVKGSRPTLELPPSRPPPSTLPETVPTTVLHLRLSKKSPTLPSQQ